VKILQYFAFVALVLQSSSKPAAIVNGQTITEAQVAKAAGSQRPAAMWKALNAIIEDKLLSAEAANIGRTKEELVQIEVDSDLPQPADQLVETFYEYNKTRFPGPRAKAIEDVRRYIFDRTRRGMYDAMIRRLSKQYGVKTFMEPLRADIVTTAYPSHGPAAAPITIVEFSDFECPYCSALLPTIKNIEKNYADKVRIVYRQFPLPWVHPHAQRAAEASLCANDQHKFWEYHDALFGNQKDLSIDGLKRRAAELKLDTAAFNACLDSGKQVDAVRKDVDEGYKVGVSGTPTVFINGRMVYGTQAYADLKEVIDDELQRIKK